MATPKCKNGCILLTNSGSLVTYRLTAYQLVSNWVEDPDDKVVIIVGTIAIVLCLFAIGYINMNPEMFQAS